MTPHDRWLEPDDEPEVPTKHCEACSGFGWLNFEDGEQICATCEGYGDIPLTDAERRQKAFDDFDPPDDYPGE